MTEFKLNEKVYIKSKGSFCPYCKSLSLNRGIPDFDAEDFEVVMQISCFDCGKEWNDIFTLTEIESLGD